MQVGRSLFVRHDWVILTLLLSFTLCACQSAPPQTVEPPPLQPWTTNFAYRASAPADPLSSGIIYYRLCSREGAFWYYPVSLFDLAYSPDRPGTTNSLPMLAACLAMEGICEALQLDPIYPSDISLEQGTALLDMPDEFYLTVRGFEGNFPKRAVEALVLSLTEFSDIEQVQFLREGKVQSFITVDMGPDDISRPLKRGWPNDATMLQGFVEKVVLYWQMADSSTLFPLTQALSQTVATPQGLFDLMMQPPILRREQAEQLNLSSFLVSPIAPLFAEDRAKPGFSLHEGTLIIDLPGTLLGDSRLAQQLHTGLLALTRTMLELSDVQRVRYLVDGQSVSLSLGLFSLAEPIERLPFINWE